MPKGRWRDSPPGPSPRRYDWQTIVAELERKPGKWMLVAEQVPRSITGPIRTRKIKALQKPGWTYRVKTSNTNNLLADIWMSAEPIEEEIAG